MAKLVVVAIPREDDYVWKISSEKVPHCTLLYLGDPVGKPVLKIAEFLQHAASIMDLSPFELLADYRGELGSDKADVVFFKKNYGMKAIKEFRQQLLKHNPIRDAYDSVEQFDEWNPHLTLGYPDKPAKEDKRDYPGVRWVEFDRIALWYGDFMGPEFRLEYNYDLAEVSMGSIADAGRDFLAHYGVKGMKWGVRKSNSPSEVTTQSVVNKGLSSKTKVKATGGKAQPATEDAIKAATQKQKLKKSGPAALSNRELQELSTRLQLENQVSQLVASPAKKFVSKTIGNTGQQQVSRVANQEASKRVDEVLKK